VPKIPVGEHTALLQTPSWIKGVLFLRGGEGGWEEGREGEVGRGTKGKEGLGKGKRRGLDPLVPLVKIH